jgi:hypothetical protein
VAFDVPAIVPSADIDRFEAFAGKAAKSRRVRDSRGGTRRA